MKFERIGMSGSAFAAFVGIKYQTFATWAQRRRKPAAQPKPPVKAVAPEATAVEGGRARTWMRLPQLCHGETFKCPGSNKLNESLNMETLPASQPSLATSRFELIGLNPPELAKLGRAPSAQAISGESGWLEPVASVESQLPSGKSQAVRQEFAVWDELTCHSWEYSLLWAKSLELTAV